MTVIQVIQGEAFGLDLWITDEEGVVVDVSSKTVTVNFMQGATVVLTKANGVLDKTGGATGHIVVPLSSANTSVLSGYYIVEIVVDLSISETLINTDVTLKATTSSEAITPYLTQEEIEAWIGWTNASLLDLGESMTRDQWSAYLNSLSTSVSYWINRFTRRGSFMATSYIEYHDGQGNTGELGGYSESDRIFFFLEQPVLSITRIDEEIGSEMGVQSWTLRTPRTTTSAGDYQVLTVGGAFTKVRFITNVPRRGNGNVRFTYSAGYPAGSPVLEEIKLIAMELVMNFLELKKKGQEADAARWNSTQDASNMFQLGDKRILTDDLKARLTPYQRRANMTYKAWR